MVVFVLFEISLLKEDLTLAKIESFGLISGGKRTLLIEVKRNLFNIFLSFICRKIVPELLGIRFITFYLKHDIFHTFKLFYPLDFQS